MPSCDFAKAIEKSWRGVVISTFGLDRLDYYSCDRIVEILDQIFGLVEAPSLLSCIFPCVLCERIFEIRERCLRPVEGWDVELMDWFAASGRKTSEQSAVEGRFEGKDGHVR